MKMIHRISLVILSLALISGVKAQEIYRLDLETSILLARQKSIRMQMLNERVNMASYNLKAALSRLKTHASLDLTLPQYTETVRQWEDSTGISFYPVRQNTFRGGLTVTQPLPTDGNLYISTMGQNFIDYYANDRNTQLSSSVGLVQPIEAFFGFNNNRMNLRQARLNFELTQKQLKREELNLVYEISQDFFQLLQEQERMKIAKMTWEYQQETYDVSKRKFEAGLLREVEAMQMEVDLSSALNEYDMAKVNYAAQVRAFKENLGINLSDSILITADLSYKPVPVDVELAVQLAMKNRPEIRENEIQIEMQEMNIRRQRAEGLASGQIQLNYNFIGVGKDPRSMPIGGTFDQTWADLTGRPGSFGIGVRATIPILDWGENRSRVDLARSQQKMNYLSMDANRIAIEREIRTTIDQLESSLRRLQLLEKSILVAQKGFDISRQRYANGEIDSEAMALDRKRISGAYTDRLNAFIAYKLLLSDLMRKTFFDFEKNKALD